MSGAKIQVAEFSSETVSEWRAPLTQNRRKYDHFFARVSVAVYLD